MAKKTQTPLQKYLSRRLPPYRRGDADCVAFVAGWVNELAPENPIILQRKTFGDVVRELREKPIIKRAGEILEDRGFVESVNPVNGDVVLFEVSSTMGGAMLGIYSEGKAITRMESEKLFIENKPIILKSWTFKP